MRMEHDRRGQAVHRPEHGPASIYFVDAEGNVLSWPASGRKRRTAAAFLPAPRPASGTALRSGALRRSGPVRHSTERPHTDFTVINGYREFFLLLAAAAFLFAPIVLLGGS